MHQRQASCAGEEPGPRAAAQRLAAAAEPSSSCSVADAGAASVGSTPPCLTVPRRCNGGHLASYSSFEEQYQTEQFFIDEGMLMPKFHKNYWMGLKTTEEDWPSFPR